MAMGYLGNGSNVYDIRIGIAQSLYKQGFRILLYRLLEVGQFGRVDKSRSHPVCRQGMRQQVICTPIDGLSRDNMVSGTGDVFESVGNGGSTRSDCQSGNSAFQCSYAGFEHPLRGVGQTSVDVPRILQAEACGSMGGITEYV